MSNAYINLTTLLSARGYDKGMYFTHEECSYLFSLINARDSRIAELEAAQRWIPVSEPPKTDGTYLLRNIYEDVYSRDFIADTNTWVLSEYDSITHWMPLPKLPEVQE